MNRILISAIGCLHTLHSFRRDGRTRVHLLGAGVVAVSVFFTVVGGAFGYFASNGTGSGTANAGPFTAGRFAHFVVADPGQQTAGLQFSLSITAVDNFSHTVTAYNGPECLTFSGPGSGPTSGSPTYPANGSCSSGSAVTFQNGVATGANAANLTLVKAETVTLTVTDNPTGFTGTRSLTVVGGTAASLGVAGFPSPQSAGVVGTFLVTAKDAFGNNSTGYTGTVHVTSSDGQAVLPANYTLLSGDAGTHSLNATLNTAGTQSITATDTVTSSITGNQTAITVIPAAANKLAFVQQPTNAVAGVSIAPSVTVAIQDAFGNQVASTASVTVAPSLQILSGTLTQPAVGGLATFNNLSMATVGSYTLSASAAGLTGATSSSFNIAPAAAATLTVSGYPSPATAGVSYSFSVTAKDAFSNTATGYAGTVHFTALGDAAAVLPANLTLSSGTGASSATFNTVAGGNKTLTATDTVTSSITGNQTAITVIPAAANKLAFVQQPTNAVAGVSIAPSVTVAIQDAFGNQVASTASVTVAPSLQILSGTLTQPAVGGLATFNNLSMATVGSYTLSASAAGLTGATSSSFNITAGVAAKLVFTQSPSNSTGGIAFATQPTVTVQDASGNIVIGDGSSVTLVLTTPAGAALACTTNPLPAASGVAGFAGCRVDLANTYSLTATDGALTLAVSNPFTIAVGAAAKLGFAQQPSAATGGVVLGTQPKVAVQDLGGNTVVGNSSSVTIAIGTNAGPGGLLAGTLASTASSGVATFSGLSIDKIGSGYTLTAADGGLTGATSSTFNITLGPAAKLAFTPSPSSPTTAGVAFATQPKVTIQDAGGNTRIADTTAVTLALTSASGATLTCTSSTLAAVAGVASFAGCKVDKAATYTFTATAGVLSALSSSFTINPGPSVSSTSPNSLGLGAVGQNVTIAGAGFVSGVGLTASMGPNITVNSTTFVSATSLTANVTISAGAATGSRDVNVTNPDGGSGVGTGKFNVTAAPTVTSVGTTTGPQGKTLNVAVNGTGFVAGTGLLASSFGPNITVNSTTRIGNTQVTANITIGQAGASTVGAVNVTVTNGDGGVATGSNLFTVTVGPSITTPNAGSPWLSVYNQNNNFDLIGTNFVSNIAVTGSGSVTAATGNWVSATDMRVSVTGGSGAVGQLGNLTVTNPDGGSFTAVNSFKNG